MRYLIYLVFFGFLFCLFGCSSQKTIINGLDERDANEIIVFLSSKGIEAQKVRVKSEAGGASAAVLWDVVVDSSVATEAMAILNANGLPRRKTSSLLNIFSTSGLVPSEMQEKIRYQSGLAEQIASTIRKIDGILDADVQLSFPEEDPLNPQKTLGKVTASVFVKHQGVLDDPNSHLATKIKRLVASSVQGLDFENVTVIADRARFSNPQTIELKPQNTVELVRVWSVAVAKDSVHRFQVIFTVVIICSIFFLLLAAWFIWRMMPLIRDQGIVPALFSAKSFSLEQEEAPAEVSEEEAKAKEEPPVKKGAGPTRENIEE